MIIIDQNQYLNNLYSLPISNMKRNKFLTQFLEKKIGSTVWHKLFPVRIWYGTYKMMYCWFLFSYHFLPRCCSLWFISQLTYNIHFVKLIHSNIISSIVFFPTLFTIYHPLSFYQHFCNTNNERVLLHLLIARMKRV